MLKWVECVGIINTFKELFSRERLLISLRTGTWVGGRLYSNQDMLIYEGRTEMAVTVRLCVNVVSR